VSPPQPSSFQGNLICFCLPLAYGDELPGRKVWTEHLIRKLVLHRKKWIQEEATQSSICIWAKKWTEINRRHLFLSSSKIMKSGDIVQWQSTCLECARTWVPFSAQERKKKRSWRKKSRKLFLLGVCKNNPWSLRQGNLQSSTMRSCLCGGKFTCY
jgi:hypothetical protein